MLSIRTSTYWGHIAWNKLKPTVGRPHFFFMLIGRQTRFWSADWSCHIKNIPHRLPSPTTKFFIRPTVARWSADCIPLFNWYMGRGLLAPLVGRSSGDRRPTIGAVGRLSADDRPIKGHRPSIWRLSPDDRPTVGRLWVAHSHMKSWLIHIWSSSDSRQTVARRWADHQNLKIVGRSKKHLVGRLKKQLKSGTKSADCHPTVARSDPPTVGRLSV